MNRRSWDRCFYGDDRLVAYRNLVGILWQAGVPDELTQVLVAAWNQTHCYPPVNHSSELADNELVQDTIVREVR